MQLLVQTPRSVAFPKLAGRQSVAELTTYALDMCVPRFIYRTWRRLLFITIYRDINTVTSCVY